MIESNLNLKVKDGGNMKRILVLIGFLTFTFSCINFRYLESNNYVKANIQIATNPRVVSDLQFIDGWSSEYGTAYSAQDVGVMVANQLAEQGQHDIWILVELSSRGNSESKDFMGRLNIWQISIYRSKNPTSP